MAPSRATPPPFVRLAAHHLRWQLLGELATSDRRVRELVASVGQPQNLVSYHLRLLREAELVTRTRSSFDARDSYYHLDLDRCAAMLAAAGSALHPVLQPGSAGSAEPRPVDRDVLGSSSRAPATARAHPSPRHCCVTGRGAGSR